MASFRQHISFSALAGALLFFVVLLWADTGVSAALLIALWCWFAGMLPDVDCDTGRPLELIFVQLAACLPFLVVVQLPQGTELSTITLVFIVAYYFVRYPLKKLFEKYSVHRGIFHSVPTGLFISALIVLAYRREGELAWLIGGGVFVGYISHLLLDEIFSVDLLRVRVKRSFGTALTLSGGSKLKTITLYAASFGLLSSLVIFG